MCFYLGMFGVQICLWPCLILALVWYCSKVRRLRLHRQLSPEPNVAPVLVQWHKAPDYGVLICCVDPLRWRANETVAAAQGHIGSFLWRRTDSILILSWPLPIHGRSEKICMFIWTSVQNQQYKMDQQLLSTNHKDNNYVCE